MAQYAVTYLLGFCLGSVCLLRSINPYICTLLSSMRVLPLQRKQVKSLENQLSAFEDALLVSLGEAHVLVKEQSLWQSLKCRDAVIPEVCFASVYTPEPASKPCFMPCLVLGGNQIAQDSGQNFDCLSDNQIEFDLS